MSYERVMPSEGVYTYYWPTGDTASYGNRLGWMRKRSGALAYDGRILSPPSLFRTFSLSPPGVPRSPQTQSKAASL